MIRHLLLVCSFIGSQSAWVQVNLVPNPSFEIYDTCPQDASKIWYATSWFQPSSGTPDYYNECFDSLQPWTSVMEVPKNWCGIQNAKTGVAYAGLFASYPFYSFAPFREYVETKLSSPLVAGQKYFVSFWLSLSDSSNYAADDIGLCFSNDSILNDTTFILYASPQIENISGSFITNKSGWTLVSGEYLAIGGEQFIAIGNFKDNSNTDTLHVMGGGDGSAGSENNAAYYYIDDICISTDSSLCYDNSDIKENHESGFLIYPNPSQGMLTVSIFDHGVIKIYSGAGDLIYEQLFNCKEKYEIDLTQLSRGVYFLHFENSTSTNYQKIILTY